MIEVENDNEISWIIREWSRNNIGIGRILNHWMASGVLKKMAILGNPRIAWRHCSIAGWWIPAMELMARGYGCPWMYLSAVLCIFMCLNLFCSHVLTCFNHLRLLRSMHRKHALKQVFCLNGNLFETSAQGAAFRHGTAWCSSTALAAFKIPWP